MKDGRKDESTLIVRSPFADMVKDIVVPDVSYPVFLFECIRKNMKVLEDRVALVDAVQGKCLMYKDIEPLAIRFASALTKRDFKKGDVFFYVTYNASLFYALQLGVQMCGGATRGCYQKEDAGELEKQMRDTKTRFILCEPETAELVKLAAERLGWPVNYFSIDGAVEWASPVEKMAYEDDGSAYNKELDIKPDEDVLFIPSTSGSTGHPKGVLHTHRNMMVYLSSFGVPVDLEREKLKHTTKLSVIGNYNILPNVEVQRTFALGNTYVTISKFDVDSFFRIFDQYKPNHLSLFAYLADVISRSPLLETRDVSFVEKVIMSGSVLSISTLETVRKTFPRAQHENGYGMSETLTVSSSCQNYKVHRDPEKDVLCKIKVLKMGDVSCVSNGVLNPLMEAKVTDVDSGIIVGRGFQGRILLRSPYIMKGYLDSTENQGYRSARDKDGWFDTGDLGFIDDDGHVYVIERLNMIFKYFMHQVSPAEIEGVILTHPSVQSVGVVGVPNPETTSAAKAYVAIKPGHKATVEEIKNHVADKLPFYKHLHGGVVFVEKLPVTRGAKLDRPALLRQAIQEMKSTF